MIRNKDSLKAKAANIAKKTNIPNKYIIQNFMFEALLRRISLSKYKEKFIIKGGLLISSIFRVNLRSTMDLDTTIKGIALNENNILKVLNEIIQIDINDNITLSIENIKEIREEDEYSGYTINLKANFDGLISHLMIDITTGDKITYKEIEYEYRTIFSKEIINVMSYNYETIIAEKFETIISKNIINTRMKDYYDLYMFVNLKWKNINIETLKKAIINTAKRRETKDYIHKSDEYIELIMQDEKIRKLWTTYKRNYEYAKEISFEDTIEAIKTINNILK